MKTRLRHVKLNRARLAALAALADVARYRCTCETMRHGLAALRRCAKALDGLIAQCEGVHEDVDLSEAVDALAALDKEAKR